MCRKKLLRKEENKFLSYSKIKKIIERNKIKLSDDPGETTVSIIFNTKKEKKN